MGFIWTTSGFFWDCFGFWDCRGFYRDIKGGYRVEQQESVGSEGVPAGSVLRCCRMKRKLGTISTIMVLDSLCSFGVGCLKRSQANVGNDLGAYITPLC